MASPLSKYMLHNPALWVCRHNKRTLLGKGEAAILLTRFQPGLIREAQLLSQGIRHGTSFELAHCESIAQQLEGNPLLDPGSLDSSRQDIVQIAISAIEQFVCGAILMLVCL